MKLVRKSINPGQHLPVSMTFKETKTQRNELPHHIHDWNELIYVYNGEGTLLIDQTLYEVNAGDLFVIPANIVHRALPSSEHLITSTAIFFSPALIQQAAFLYAHTKDTIFHLARTEKNYRFHMKQSTTTELEHYLSQLHREMNQSVVDSEKAIFLWLQLILVHLNRHCMSNTTTIKSTNEPEWIREILSYIENHLDQKLELEELARIASISTAHLSRVFKKYLGIGLSDYITSKRLAKAKHQLLNTDMKIENVADSCGFASMPHFYRTFKRHTDLTPAAYRKAEAIDT